MGGILFFTVTICGQGYKSGGGIYRRERALYPARTRPTAKVSQRCAGAEGSKRYREGMPLKWDMVL